MAGNRKGQADIAPRIRGAFIRACEYNANKRGKDLTSLIADSLISDTLGTLKAMASFNPSQSRIDITHKIEISEIIALAHQRQAQLKDITPQVLEQQDNNSDGVIDVQVSEVIEGQTPSTKDKGQGTGAG